MFTRLLLMGASALVGAAIGYQQGREDSIREQNGSQYGYAVRPSLAKASKDLFKKTATSVKQTVDDIANSKEYDTFKTKFSKEELMRILCNSQVFDTVNDILRKNNGEYRPGSYFKGKEWEKYKEHPEPKKESCTSGSCSQPDYIGANINITSNK